MASKRLLVPGLIQPSKRSRFETVGNVLTEGIRRTSNLCTPVVRLEDHEGDIFCCKFHPKGELVMSAGFDKQIHISCVYGEESAALTMTGHSNCVTETQFSSDGSSVYSSSQDTTVAVWDIATGTRLKQFECHKSAVNSVNANPKSSYLLCSGSDDSTIRLWDVRDQFSSQWFESNFQVTSTCFNERGDHIISAGVDNDIKIWDIRMNEIVSRLQGHIDMVSGISLSPCGEFLLSTSLDNTLRIWDIRPYVEGERCVDIYTSNQYITEGNLLRCAWSKDGTKISAGSSDHNLYIWDVANHRILYKLPGHEGSINDVDFHPIESIILSGSSCKNLFMHEFDC